MAVAWPSTLQDLINEQGFALNKGETVLRSDVDVGPNKVRRRFTRPIDTMSGVINLTSVQYEDFEFFFDTETNGGTLPFEFNHPITGVLTLFRFTGPVNYRSIGGGNFQVSMAWEILGDA